MMGRRKSEQGQLFYAFNLDAVVPDDPQVRRIAAVLDLSWARNWGRTTHIRGVLQSIRS